MSVLSVDAHGDRESPAAILTDPAAMTAVRVQFVLKLQRGTYIADLDRGMPWAEWLDGGKPPTAAVIAATAARQAERVTGVESVDAVDVQFEPPGCIFVSMTLTAATGESVTVIVNGGS